MNGGKREENRKIGLSPISNLRDSRPNRRRNTVSSLTLLERVERMRAEGRGVK